MGRTSHEAEAPAAVFAAQEAEVLSRITALFQVALPLDEVLKRILQGVTEGLDIERAELFMLDERDRVLVGRQVVFRHESHEQDPATQGARIPIGDERELLSAAVLEGRTQIIDEPGAAGGLTLNKLLRPLAEAGSFAAVPLLACGQVVGVIALNDRRGGRPSLRDRVPLLNAYAVHAGLAIERARLYEDREKAIRDLTLLQKMTANLQESRPMDDVLLRILQGVTEAVEAERAILYLHDPVRGVLRGAHAIPREVAQAIRSIEIPVDPSDEIISATVVQRRPFIVERAEAGRRSRLMMEHQASDCFIAAPLLARGRVVGVITVDGFGGAPAIRERLHLLAACGIQAGLAIDRTDLEAKLRASEKQHRELIEMSPDGIAESTIEGKILSCNEALARMLGYCREELLAMNAVTLLVDGSQRERMIARCMSEGTLEGAPVDVRAKGGAIRHMSVSMRIRQEPGGPVLESIIRDQTDQHETERKLRALTNVVNYSADAIIAVDPERLVTSWNMGAESILGYPAAEMIGQPYDRLVPEDLRAQFTDVMMRRVEQEGRLLGFETESLRKDGTRIPVSITVSRLQHNGGPCLGWSVILRDLTESRTLAAVSQRLAEELSTRSRLDGIVGVSRTMEEIRDRIRRVARFNSSVMLVGPSGTGKEVVANAIHHHSPRHDKPLIKMNCAAIPDDLLESELFGIERNVATGVDGRIGRFEMAEGGTLFLDEIGDMSLTTQAKILRALQEREFERVGGKKVIKVDVRIIAATNKNLEEEIRARRFRDDLYYRLNVIVITLPPLAERREDIEPLIDHFLERVSRENNLPRRQLSLAARMILNEYEWPGNVRELEHCIERAVVMSEGAEVGPADLPPHILIWKELSTSGESRRPVKGGLHSAVRDVEKRTLIDALDRAGGVQARAARLLGISERSMWYRVKKFGIGRTHS